MIAAVPPLVVLVLSHLPKAITGAVLGVAIIVCQRLLLLHGVTVLRVLIARPYIVVTNLAIALAVHIIDPHPAAGLEGVHEHHLALGIDVGGRHLMLASPAVRGGHGHHDRARLSRYLDHLHRLQDLTLPVGGWHGHVEHLRLLLGYDGHGDVLRLEYLLLLLLLLDRVLTVIHEAWNRQWLLLRSQ